MVKNHGRQWRNLGGLVEMAPLGGKKSPPQWRPWFNGLLGAISEIMAEKSE